MSKDKELLVGWTERRLDLKRLVFGSAGAATEADAASQLIKQMAGEAFANDNEAKAKILRDLSKVFVERSKAHRKRQSDLEEILKEEFPDD